MCCVYWQYHTAILLGNQFGRLSIRVYLGLIMMYYAHFYMWQMDRCLNMSY